MSTIQPGAKVNRFQIGSENALNIVRMNMLNQNFNSKVLNSLNYYAPDLYHFIARPLELLLARIYFEIQKWLAEFNGKDN
jgi:hypothetical protein